MRHSALEVRCRWTGTKLWARDKMFRLTVPDIPYRVSAEGRTRVQLDAVWKPKILVSSRLGHEHLCGQRPEWKSTRLNPFISKILVKGESLDVPEDRHSNESSPHERFDPPTSLGGVGHFRNFERAFAAKIPDISKSMTGSRCNHPISYTEFLIWILNECLCVSQAD